MTDQFEIYRGSGNVFADLGCENPEELLAKADIVLAINTLIKSLTYNEITRLLEIGKSQIKDLQQGRLGKFSIEQLSNFLSALENERGKNVITTNN